MLVAAAPALLVALTAHVAGFGSSHVLGGETGRYLFTLALAWAALLTVAGILSIALRTRGLGVSPRAAAATLAEALPGRGGIGSLTASLAAGGYAFYLVLEALEGHGLQGSRLSLGIILPLAAAIAAVVRLSLTWIAGAGLSLSELAGRAARAAEPWFRPAPIPVRVARPVERSGRRRGRAPPQRA